MLRLVIMCLALVLAPVCLADKITTIDDVVFEGIVSEFSKDKGLDLQTGFGRLSFLLRQVKSAAKSDYQWPKTCDISKPTRSKAFEDWVVAMKPAWDKANPPAKQPLPEKKPVEEKKDAGRILLPATKETDELDGAGFSKRMSDVRAIKEDKTKSVKEKKDAFKAFGKKWAYLSVRVEKAEETEAGDIRVRISQAQNDYSMTWPWYDARTGEPANMWNRAELVIVAKKDLDSEGVDKMNKFEESKETRTAYYIDYSVAEQLKAGDGIVFKLTLDCNSGDEVWAEEITRLGPRAKPKPKSDEG